MNHRRLSHHARRLLDMLIRRWDGRRARTGLAALFTDPAYQPAPPTPQPTITPVRRQNLVGLFSEGALSALAIGDVASAARYQQLAADLASGGAMPSDDARDHDTLTSEQRQRASTLMLCDGDIDKAQEAWSGYVQWRDAEALDRQEQADV